MNKTVLINGMSCGHCTAAVEKALSGLNGTSDINVSLEDNNATLEVTESVTDEMIKNVIEDQGYEVVRII